MIIKLKNLIKLTRQSLTHDSRIQNRLIIYWISMVLVLIGVLLLVMALTGVFSTSEKKLSKELSMSQNAFMSGISNQMDSLESSAIALSENAAVIIDDALGIRSVSTLNNDLDGLKDMETSLFPLVSNVVDSSQCSGAFIVLNATANTSADKAESSRAGLYVRYANLSTTKSARQDKVLFRGIADVARDRSVEMHNRWNLEFNISNLPGYGQLINHTSGRLADNCLWSDKITLPGTWESAVLLSVPIMGKNGEVRGVCGMEISDLYFRLAYPASEGDFGSVIALMAPVSGDTVCVSDGLCSGTDGISLKGIREFSEDKGSDFNLYTNMSRKKGPGAAASGRYLGMQKLLNVKTSDGLPLAIFTLVSEDNYKAALKKERLVLSLYALAYLILATALCIYLSRRFIKPIAAQLDSLTEERNNLAQSNESAQKEIARLAYSRKTEVDPGDYAHFIEGLSKLTPKEREIFDYYVSGMTVKDIQDAAGIKESTIRYHNRNIYSKLGVNSLKQLLRYAALMNQDK